MRVADAHYWQDMAGDNSLEKIINAYLTTQFVLSKDIPADECLSEARKIIEIVQAYGENGDSGAAWDVLGRDKFPEQWAKESK